MYDVAHQRLQKKMRDELNTLVSAIFFAVQERVQHNQVRLVTLFLCSIQLPLLSGSVGFKIARWRKRVPSDYYSREIEDS